MSFRRTVAAVALILAYAVPTQAVVRAAEHPDEQALRKYLKHHLPTGWEYEMTREKLVVRSPKMKLTPSLGTGSVVESLVGKDGSFEIYFVIGERLPVDEHTRRVEKYERDLEAFHRRVGPTGKGIEFPEPWMPDYYGPNDAYKAIWPSYIPVRDGDRDVAAAVFNRIVKHWQAYPKSRFDHAVNHWEPFPRSREAAPADYRDLLDRLGAFRPSPSDEQTDHPSDPIRKLLDDAVPEIIRRQPHTLRSR